MDEQPIREVPPAAPAGGADWKETPAANYPPANAYSQTPPTGATEGLSDTAAGALAYVTIIPAILFLVLAPYNTRPFVKFHAFQCLGLAVVWFCVAFVNIIPILGQLVFLVATITFFVTWVLCILKASQGGALKLPVIGDFAAKQSGYNPR
jgi:uncharacterized membrane protein